MATLSTFSAAHQEALELDVSVIEALLRRNRCSHSRTKYYQRLSMAFRALQPMLDLQPSLQSLADELQEQERQKRKKRKLERVFWEISKEDDKSNQQQTVRDQLVAIEESLCHILPTVLSRLEYAATAFFQEMARGFFLSLCTVAVGAMARVRSLLMQLGRYALSQLDPLEQLYRSVYDNDESLWDRTLLEKAKAAFVEQSDDVSKQTREERTRQSLKSLGIAVNFLTDNMFNEDETEEDYTTSMHNSVETDDNDIGESVKEMDLPANDGLDNNMSFVNELKTQKTKAKKNASSIKKEKRKKRSGDKAEKKKKAKKGDFFDGLFS